MHREGLDLIAFPANCDISRADAETDQRSSDHAWTNGTVFSNMNHVMRHLGIPSVSVPMGIMADTAMPVNVTFCGPGWSDFALLHAAYDYEQASRRRVAPAFTPALALEPDYFQPEPPKSVGPIGIELSARAVLNADVSVTVRGEACANAGAGPASLSLFLDGVPIAAGTGAVEIDWTVSRGERGRLFRSLLCALAYGGDGQVAARFIEMPYA